MGLKNWVGSCLREIENMGKKRVFQMTSGWYECRGRECSSMRETSMSKSHRRQVRSNDIERIKAQCVWHTAGIQLYLLN
jgi:hypothetical protein